MSASKGYANDRFGFNQTKSTTMKHSNSKFLGFSN